MLQPMPVATKFVLLMHPHEVKRVKANTGRFTSLSLQDSEMLVGIEFDSCTRLRELLADPEYYPVLLYPREGAVNVSEGELSLDMLNGRRLLVIVLDATWALAKKMLRMSPILHSLPALMFTPRALSRWRIKQQPDSLCLSTLEAVHELLLALEASGLDHYERPTQLLDVFEAMQDFQEACARDPSKRNYRNKPYQEKTERRPTRCGKNARSLFYKGPASPQQ